MNEIRRKQLKLLNEKYKASQKGFSMILLKGEAGMGKTYLIRTFLNTVETDPVLVARGRCNYQTGRYEPYLPFKDLLKALVERSYEESADKPKPSRLKKTMLKSVHTLVKVAPDLVDTFVPSGSLLTKIGTTLYEETGLKKVVDAKIASQQEGSEYRIDEAQIHKQYINFLKALSKEQPLVLVLEDLHWLDEASLNLLLPLTQKLRQCRIFLIGSLRSNEIVNGSDLFSILNELKRNMGSIELDIDVKNEDEKSALLNAMLDERSNTLEDDFREKLRAITNGNPLFIQELLESFFASNQLVENSEGTLMIDKTIDWDTIPEKLEAVVLSRLAKLDEETKALLSYASTQGSSFLVQVLSTINKIDDRELLRVFVRKLLKEHKLLQEGESQRINKKIVSQFHFSHGLVQQYLYNDLMLSERMLYHQETAEALEALYGEQLNQVYALIAYHYEKAEIHDKAVTYFEQAGDEALIISAFREAFSLFSKALDLVEILIEEGHNELKPTKLRLLVRKSVALKPIVGWLDTKVTVLCEQAYKLGLELEAYETIAPIMFGLWTKHFRDLELEEALHYAQRYQYMVQQLGDPRMLPEGKNIMGITYFWMGKLDQSLEQANALLDEFDPELHKDSIHRYGQDPRATASMVKMLSLSVQGHSKAAGTFAYKALEWANTLNHPLSKAIILAAIAWKHFQEEDISTTHEICRKLKEICRKYDFAFYLGISYFLLIPELIENGDYKKAEATLEFGYQKIIGEEGGITFSSIYQVFKSRLKAGQGKVEEALGEAEKGIELALKQKALVYYPLLLKEKAKALAALGAEAKAEKVIEEAKHFAHENGMLLFIKLLNQSYTK